MQTYATLEEVQKSAGIEKQVFSRILPKTQVVDGVIISHIADSDTEEYERIFEDQVNGTELGALFATYLNVPLKANYEALARNPTFSSLIPPYFYSCPTIDSMLLGHHPRTYYFDISRGGPVSVMRRSMGYLSLAQEKHFKSTNPLMKKWVERFGLGTCVPVMTFDSLVSYTIENNARLYAVPATSVAESLTACAAYFTGMRSDVKRITAKDDWMHTSGQSRNKGSLRIYEALHKYIIETRGHAFFKELIISGSNLTQIAQLYMEMTEREFILGHTREQICRTFAEIMFDPQSHRSHPSYGAQADCSELVVRSKNLLSPIPWEVMFLFGDSYGTTLSQLIDFAKATKSCLPHSVIIILVNDQDEPLLPEDSSSVIPSIADYAITAWSSYILGKKISLQRGHLTSQMMPTR